MPFVFFGRQDKLCLVPHFCYWISFQPFRALTVQLWTISFTVCCALCVGQEALIWWGILHFELLWHWVAGRVTDYSFVILNYVNNTGNLSLYDRKMAEHFHQYATETNLSLGSNLNALREKLGIIWRYSEIKEHKYKIAKSTSLFLCRKQAVNVHFWPDLS